MSTVFLDCASGISGDMTVAALLDLGADVEHLKSALSSLPLDGYEVKISRVLKSGIDTCDFLVDLHGEYENHDHDMAYLHGDHEHGAAHSQGDHEHGAAHSQGDHEHGAAHSQGDHGHGHAPHRNLNDIEQILRSGNLTPRALELALKIFRIVAEAEAHVHGKSVQEVHFHEVGAVDSIIDIAAAAICIDDLGIDHVIIPSLTEGIGQVRCQHGILPIPVPATAAIAAAYHLPLHISSVSGELITPTGAAIAAALCTDQKLPENFSIEKIGIGAGKRDYKTAGILRAMLIREWSETDQVNQNQVKQDPIKQDQVLLMQTNLDDCTGETLGFVMELLMEKGALDVYYTPIYMKKNRPAVLLSVLCGPDMQETMEDIIFTHTTGIGIRRTMMERSKLPRETQTVVTPLGKAAVKICTWKDQTYCYPEYENAAALARQSGKSIGDIMQMIRNSWENLQEHD